ncbi:hypothetical protein OG730_41830 (plasmid) [Streptomyces sp. NBC_01298]|uniref:hypothetical protein n=1 Tax=Streptomyces sp. NBC_01298 TaxID=2903817 RepID=UPI002E1166EF|nr:hypothetical protein OG730_41830 [Streptomyces sp. NBC_01298]
MSSPNAPASPEAPAPAKSPLRGEQHMLSPSEVSTFSKDAARQTLAAWTGQSADAPQSWASVPKEFATVLAPVEAVFGQVARRAARHAVVAAARRELQLLRGVFGPGEAERLLNARLSRRLTQQRQSQASIDDPAGWIIGRALPRRGNCYDNRCDEGRRMDTEGTCPACVLLIADRRALRHSVAARLSGSLSLARPGQAPRQDFETLLRQEFAEHEARRAVHRERAIAERTARDAAVAAHRAQVKSLEAERMAAPCLECGGQTEAEVCGICSSWQAVELAAAESADLARVTWTAAASLAARERTADHAAAEVRAEAEQAASRGRVEGATAETAACMAKLAAELTAGERRRAALATLALGSRAEAEAAGAFEAELRRTHLHPSADDAHRSARAAAEAARLRVAEHLVAAALAEGRERRREEPQLDETDPYRLGAARVRAELRRTSSRAA